MGCFPCYIVILVSTFTFLGSETDACIFKSSWHIFSSTPESFSQQQGPNPLVLDKDTVSVVEQTLVKTLITMGKLKFHCPRDDGLYSDMLDCRQYYNCSSGNFTVHDCEIGTGFEPMAKSCVRNESVPLCQRVQRLADYKCNSTGLHIFAGSCEKFVLCTDEAAFTSSCNRGDLFHQQLKLCLPEQEVNCTSQELNATAIENDNRPLSN